MPEEGHRGGVRREQAVNTRRSMKPRRLAPAAILQRLDNDRTVRQDLRESCSDSPVSGARPETSPRKGKHQSKALTFSGRQLSALRDFRAWIHDLAVFDHFVPQPAEPISRECKLATIKKESLPSYQTLHAILLLVLF